MEKEFSPEFFHDMADVIRYCIENNRDSIRLKFDFEDYISVIDMKFSTIKKEV